MADAVDECRCRLRHARACANGLAMTANTPHIVFDELAARSTVPLLSIVEVCANEAHRRGLKRMLLLGTRFTMQAPFYSKVFARHDMTRVTPNDDERTWVHARYIGELLKGDFRDDTREQFIALITRIRDEQRGTASYSAVPSCRCFFAPKPSPAFRRSIRPPCMSMRSSSA
ncbi:MAG: aspartate/glutamate racemase family protein [bacterium]